MSKDDYLMHFDILICLMVRMSYNLHDDN